MPKKIKNCFYKNLTFEKLLEAHYRARKNKTYKAEIIRFELDLERNIVNLLNNLKNGTYQIGEYRKFIIYEPKERVIKALPYIDRIVHQWYVEEFIKPYIIPKFIKHSFACLENRGTHKAVETVQRAMRIYKRKKGNYWILKCDISKFFYSINPDILYRIMEKYIADKALLNFTKFLIYSDKSSKLGIPIGNYCSQYFANVYLHELDTFVKHNLHIKYYNRFMDDFVLLLDTKTDCIRIKKEIEKFLNTNLKLKLNEKSKYYPSKMGVNYCGYRIFETHRLLRLNSKKKIKVKVKKWNKLYLKKTLNLEKARCSLTSWLGHSSHCNSYKLQKKILESCNFIYSNCTDEKILEQIMELMEKDYQKVY